MVEDASPSAVRPEQPNDASACSLLAARVPDLIAVYRFGSSVRGALRPDSDLDYAVLARAPLDPMARFEIQEDLASVLGRPVDLVDLRVASTVLRAQVISGGMALVVRDPADVERFEVAAYAAYARLNEERREILTQIAREKTIHGR